MTLETLSNFHYFLIFYFQPGHVTQRVPVSESLTQLHRDQLQKFAQYLIAEMPKEVILCSVFCEIAQTVSALMKYNYLNKILV